MPAIPPDERNRPAAAGADAEAAHQEGIPLRRPDARAALRHPGFLLWVVGSLISNTGNGMRTAAVGWEVYGRTGEALSLGLVGLVLALPVLLLALPAGVAADRYPRRALIMIAQVGLAACGLGLAWASATEAPLAVFYALLLGTGVFRAIGWPAASAIVPGLVPEGLVPNAVMWRSVAFQLSATIGPLAGGLLLAAWSPAGVYFVDALSSFFLVACVFFVRPRPHVRSVEPGSWRSLLDGARFVRRQPLILSTITLDMVAVLFGGATALLPIYARDILHVGATGFGWLRAMPAIGAIAMGLLLAWRPPMQRAGRALVVAVAAFGVATVVFGLSRHFGLSLAALFVLGAADNVSVVVRSTVLQLLTPDAMRGRVSAVSAVFVGTSNEIGELESGVAAHGLGTVVAVAGGGVMTLVTVAVAMLVWPGLLRLGRLEDLRPAEHPPRESEEPEARAAPAGA